jgi:hypothetical protein
MQIFISVLPLESNQKQVFRWVALYFIYSQTVVTLYFKILYNCALHCMLQLPCLHYFVQFCRWYNLMSKTVTSSNSVLEANIY